MLSPIVSPLYRSVGATVYFDICLFFFFFFLSMSYIYIYIFFMATAFIEVDMDAKTGGHSRMYGWYG